MRFSTSVMSVLMSWLRIVKLGIKLGNSGFSNWCNRGGKGGQKRADGSAMLQLGKLKDRQQAGGGTCHLPIMCGCQHHCRCAAA